MLPRHRAVARLESKELMSAFRGTSKETLILAATRILLSWQLGFLIRYPTEPLTEFFRYDFDNLQI